MDENSLPSKVRVGSRKSNLALIQTNIVIDELKKRYIDKPIEFEVVAMSTLGDHILDKPFSQIDSKSLFTKELEELLIEDKIDLIVHSLKDLPTVLPKDLCICAILK
jgi:porphobilinogen deaminase, dipyromethane cofactor binding domain